MPKFKKKVALDAIKDQQTVSQLAGKHNVHLNQIKAWKKVLEEGCESLFERKNS